MKALLVIGILVQGQPPMQQCQEPRAFVAELLARYGEKPVFAGLGQSGVMMTFASPKGSWTIAVQNPQSGMLCGLAAGQNFRAMPMALPGQGT